MQMQSLSIFPSICHFIHDESYQDTKDSLIKWLYDYSKKNKGVEISNAGGYQSSSDFYYDRGFKPYLKRLTGLLGQLSNFYTCSFAIKNMWFNINKPGDYNKGHIHPDCDMVGVWWLQCDDKSGTLQFDNPNLHGQYKMLANLNEQIKKEVNFYTCYFLQPTEGTIALMPSNLYHWVEKNESSKDRISIAFNLGAV